MLGRRRIRGVRKRNEQFQRVKLCTRGGRLLTPIGAAASAFQAREPVSRKATPAKAKSIFLDITSSLFFLLLWVFHHALPTGCVEFLLVDVSVIVGIDLRKIHDVGRGVCLR